jgi:type VI secretion system secreted protein Hcp
MRSEILDYASANAEDAHSAGPIECCDRRKPYGHTNLTGTLHPVVPRCTLPVGWEVKIGIPDDWRQVMNAKRILWVFAAALVVCLVAASQAFAAFDAYMTIKGTKQGQFKAETTGAGAGKISISDFSYMASAPTDRNAGMASGKRMHSAFTIKKSIDQASPQLMQAMTTGEVLTSVDIEFVHPGARGPEVYKTLHLTDAVITSIRASGAGAGKTEEITFTAESENVQAMNKSGGKTAMDDWTAMN